MKIVFLDRDGVINEFPGNGNYVTKVKDFHFLPRAREAVKTLTDAGFKVFIISNQAGVGKGIFSQEKLTLITRKMLDGIRETGGRIEKVYYAISRASDECDYRKPGIGFIREALNTLNKTIRFAPKTYFVGDTESDMIAGHHAGCKTIFVLSGQQDRENMRKWTVKPDHVAKDLYEAVKIIQRMEKVYLKKSHRNKNGTHRKKKSSPPKSQVHLKGGKARMVKTL